jgi:hypothetical protein
MHDGIGCNCRIASVEADAIGLVPTLLFTVIGFRAASRRRQFLPDGGVSANLQGAARRSLADHAHRAASRQHWFECTWFIQIEA